MKYLKKFETQQDYEAFISVMVKPNVSLIDEQDVDVIYNPFINTTGVTLNTDSLSFVGTGSTQSLVATVLPNNATDKSVTWESSDDTIATVSDNGVVTAVDYGNAVITVTTTNGGITANCSVDIAKNQGQVTTAPTAITGLTYNGSAQALVTAGVGTGTMMYKLDDGEWGTSIPTATNATSYTVCYKASASTDYTESASGSVSVTIAKVTPTVTTPTANVLTYNGSAQELVNAGSTDFGTLKYSLDGDTYSTSIPTAINYGSYTVYYKVEGDSNVNDVAPSTVQCSINEKQVTATVELSQTAYTYNGTAFEPSVTVKDGGTVIDPSEYTVTYSNNTNAGTATVTISDNVGGNYEVIGSTTFTINKAAGSVTTAPTAITGLTPTGSAQALVNAGSGTGTMLYNLNGGSWGTSIPTATNVGTYTVGYKAAESTNYTESTSGSVNVTIDYASVDLGLPSGTKWATMNIGASSETDYGNYYQYGKGASQYAATSGQSDYNGTENPLSSSVDTAAQVWGGSWHMPTQTQLKELTANTTYEWTTINGVNGSKFTAANGNYVFLPAAGMYINGSRYSVGSGGFYWSSSPNGSDYAHYMSFDNSGKGVDFNDRKRGYSVRGVLG